MSSVDHASQAFWKSAGVPKYELSFLYLSLLGARR